MEKALTGLSYIRDLSERYGFRFDRKYGQNFLINPSVCPRMAESSGIGPGCGVIEIGPGFGTLTRELARLASKVVCIEIDTSLEELLKETLAGYDNVKVIFDDFMKVDLSRLIREEFGSMPVYVCANLPYYITSPIIMKLLEDRPGIEAVTVMVQKEAAQRICAEPGTRESGSISLAVRYYADAKVCFTVSPGSFYPAPKVTSSVIRLDVRKAPPVEVKSEKALFRMIRAAFSQRRKTLANSVSNSLDIERAAVEEALSRLGLDTKIRPERMRLEDFAALSDRLGM